MNGTVFEKGFDFAGDRTVFEGSDRWIWLNKPYDGGRLSPVILSPIHVGDGRQHVFWQEQALTGEWLDARRFGLAYGDWPRVTRTFPTVTGAADALLRNGMPGGTYRLCRFDRTPLITVRLAYWDRLGKPRVQLKRWEA